jgi:hypothetical protein
MIVRLVAAMILISWSQIALAGAVEAIRLPMSCNYIGNKVMLVPAPSDQLHVIVGDRERKTIRGCWAGKCRNWEVHRFDLLCGGRSVSWRQIAGQLMNVVSAERKDGPFRNRLEPWELRAAFTEPEFAPVDEFGGRILSVADKPMPQSSTGRDGASPKPVMATDAASPPPGSPKSEPDTASPKIEPPKPAAAAPLYQAEPSPPHAPGTAHAETTNIALPAGKADATPADVPASTHVEGPKRDVNPPSAPEIATADATAANAPPASTSAAQPLNTIARLFSIVLVSMLLLTIVLLAIFGALMWRKSASSRQRTSYSGIVRAVYENDPAQAEPDADASAEACRELMKEVAAELVKAMTAVSGLRRVPALQTAMHAELESIRRSLGFTPQIRGTPGEKKDWKQIKSQLVLSLHGTQRIIALAEAARTSFSVHPAALEVITTRLEAYAFLGVNANSSDIVLKKAVNALRECWHPDLATNEEDRRLREVRIKQINVAWDLITGKQMSY